MDTRSLSILPVVFLAVGPSVALCGRAPSDSGDGESDLKTKDLAMSALAALDRFVGPWSVVENHINSKGEVFATVKGTEEILWTLDKRAIRRTYLSGGEPIAFRAIGMLTWNAARQRLEGAWFDNAPSTSPTRMSCTWDGDSLTLTCEVTPLQSDDEKGHFKVIERFLDDDHRVATTYRVRGNQVLKILEVQYVRTIPCPATTSGVRVVEPELARPHKN